ncbi:MAG TPA: c-type cytochrome [Bryobacteraceae bacterium]|nr:c-type cytochrome [Bryobacteraceae bacterium]
MASRVVTAFLIAFVLFACTAANAQPVIKKVPVSRTSAASGHEMFKTYCSPCHGLDGKGTGPAAAALKKAPANLTELTARNNGQFPELKVFATIKGDVDVTAHGTRDMPVWGALFPSVSSSQGEVQLRISNLTDYVKSIQAK